MLIFNKQISTARDLIFKFTYYSVVAAAGIDVAVRLQLPDAWYFDTFDTVQSVTATSFFAFFAFVCQSARIKNYTLFFSSFFPFLSLVCWKIAAVEWWWCFRCPQRFNHITRNKMNFVGRSAPLCNAICQTPF